MATNGMRPVHPGEILREDYLRELGMSANALAKALAVPAPRINDIVRGRRGTSADSAVRLARYFRTTPQFWLYLQAAHDLRSADRFFAVQVCGHALAPVRLPHGFAT